LPSLTPTSRYAMADLESEPLPRRSPEPPSGRSRAPTT
jgi:hypothetical protein